jgi:F-type H+-transporting ATPase subunit gamma
MANTKIIKQKIKATTSIKKITKTMEMVAVSKMKKSVKEASDISEYIKQIKFVINNIKSESQETHRLFDDSIKVKSKGGSNIKGELVIIFASNKGLCGSFNTNIYKKTKKLKEENPNLKYAICFGKFAEKIARKLGLEIKLSYLEIEKVVKPSQVSKTESFLRDAYLYGDIAKVHAIYTNFIKMGSFEPRSVTIYPVSKDLNIYDNSLGGNSNIEIGKDGNVEASDNTKQTDFFNKERAAKKTLYSFEPNMFELIDKAIPKIIKMVLYSFILESRASENSSRSFAMKRANESAGEMLHTLKIKFNKVRQDSITQEIAEISAGANAG